MPIITLDSPSGLTIYHSGPSFDRGALPTFIYFALSGSESLELDPYSQPVKFLADSQVRIFSFSLPGHPIGADHRNGMANWAEGLLQSENFLEDFLQQAVENIDFLIAEGFVDDNHIASGGLSRGGFMATHLAARHSKVNTVVGFSPLTALRPLREFELLTQDFLKEINLEKQIPKLIGKRIRYYIGNRDMRVGTPTCFDFTHKLTEAAYISGVRTPSVELFIYPSIGHKGHGTPTTIFESGAHWIKEKIKEN